MKLMKNLFYLAVVGAAIITLSACSPSSDAPPLLDSNEEPLVISATSGSFGVSNAATEENLTINIDDITAMDSVSMDVLQKTSGGDSTINVIGTDFNNLLATYDLSQKELSSLRLEAMDGYSMDIPKEVIDNRTILLVYAVDGKPLAEAEAPVWVVIPEERAMYWVKNIKTMHLNEDVETKETAPSSLIFLDTLFASVDKQEYEGESVVSGLDVFNFANVSDKTTSVTLEAIDGLEKSETFEILSGAYITTTGELAPKITGENIPEGMRVKNVLSFSADDKMLFSFSNFKTKSEDKTLGDVTGTPISDVLDAAKMANANSYIFTASDGYEKEIPGADIEKGLIYINDEGNLATYFDGLPKNTTIMDLKSITAK